MASRWSSENVVVDCKDLQANCMAVDQSGRFTLLGARRILAIVDLDSPHEPYKTLKRQSKWEVSALRWNPHDSHRQIFVAASNQRADVHVLNESLEAKKTEALKGHTRVISDVDWSPHEPKILATCSVDTFTNLWDIRDTRRPSMSLQAVAGVSQVKWSKLNTNLLATAHDRDIRIWDPRKSNSPIQYIAAHLSKIHGLDWSPYGDLDSPSGFRLASSSQDCTVKFWDVTSPRRAESTLSSGSPVWRARYTPFGRGLVTVVVPQLRRGENSLLLWSTEDLSQPVHTFVGHTDVVLEFDWITNENSSEHQLITWSKDQSLRIWKIEPSLRKLCGQSDPDSDTPIDSEAQDEMTEPISFKLTKDIDQSESALQTPPQQILMYEKISPQQPKTLEHEFELVNVNIPNIKVEELAARKRTCTVSAVSGKHIVNLQMSFPALYPNNAAPTFEFGGSTTINKESQAKLAKVLQDASLQLVKRNQSCLEPCLRKLISSLDQMTIEERRTPDSETPYNRQQPSIKQASFIPLYSYGSYQDSAIPFPRTSGARFCGAGFLVAFTRPGELRKAAPPAETPKSLSALSAYAQTNFMRPQAMLYNVARSPPTDLSVSNFYLFKDRKRHARAKQRSHREAIADATMSRDQRDKTPKKAGPVLIYDTSSIIPVNKYLAKNYSLDCTDVPATCNKNAAVCGAIGRRDLQQMWSVLGLAASRDLECGEDPDHGAPWAMHPFGRALLKSFFDQYESIYDVQTLAMLCCVFGALDGPPPVVHPPKTDRNNSLDFGNTEDTLELEIEASTESSEVFVCLADKALAEPTRRLLSECLEPPERRLSTGNAERRRGSTVQVMVLERHYSAGHEPPEISPGSAPETPQRVRRTTVPSQTPYLTHALPIPAVGHQIRRSNSWSDPFDEYRFGDEGKDPDDDEKEKHEQNKRLLDVHRSVQYDQFKLSYARILYCWRLHDKRLEVLKHVHTPPDNHKGVEFVTLCSACQTGVRGAHCGYCKNFALQCSICHISVRGASNFCLACSHGGHAEHMAAWFRTHQVCPTGCGCNCLTENPMVES